VSEIINIKVSAGSRTIYLDVKEQEDGSRFLSIREVKHGGDDAGGSRVIVDQKYIRDVHRAIEDVLAFIEPGTKWKAYTLADKRAEHARAYAPWTHEQDVALTQGFRAGRSRAELSKMLGRSEDGISARLLRLGLIDRR
jgi:hypothetical protein